MCNRENNGEMKRTGKRLIISISCLVLLSGIVAVFTYMLGKGIERRKDMADAERETYAASGQEDRQELNIEDNRTYLRQVISIEEILAEGMNYLTDEEMDWEDEYVRQAVCDEIQSSYDSTLSRRETMEITALRIPKAEQVKTLHDLSKLPQLTSLTLAGTEGEEIHFDLEPEMVPMLEELIFENIPLGEADFLEELPYLFQPFRTTPPCPFLRSASFCVVNRFRSHNNPALLSPKSAMNFFIPAAKLHLWGENNSA